jgi:hypothetical protein
MEVLATGERIILKWFLRDVMGGNDCINLAQERGNLRAIVDMVMNLRILSDAGDILAS